jgi:hypothetical protein
MFLSFSGPFHVAAKSFVLSRWPNLLFSRPHKEFRGTRDWPAPRFPAKPVYGAGLDVREADQVSLAGGGGCIT